MYSGDNRQKQVEAIKEAASDIVFYGATLEDYKGNLDALVTDSVVEFLESVDLPPWWSEVDTDLLSKIIKDSFS